jgi:hypothetical protein
MFGRKKGALGIGHVKSKTLGTSNEITFSVLDAKRDMADSGEKSSTANELSFDVLDVKRSQLDGESGRSNEKKAKKQSGSGGLVSLLFSKVAIPKTKDVNAPSEIDLSEGAASGTGFDSVNESDSRSVIESPAPVTSQDDSSEASRKRQAKLAAAAEKEARKAEARESRSAARAEARAKREEARKRKREERRSLDRVQSASQPYTEETAQRESERRKKIRRRRRLQLRAAVIIVVIVGVGVAGYFGFRQYELHNNQNGILETAVSKISSADGDIVKLDELIADPMSNVSGQEWKDLDDRLDESASTLDSATSDAEDLLTVLTDEKKITAADQIADACSSRKSMIDSGRKVFSQATEANDALSSLNTIWNDVLAADAVAREGVALLSSGSLDDSMQSAREKISQASGQFSDINSRLSQLEMSYENLDLSAQKSYLAKRIEALGYATATASALTDRNKEEASNQAALYNTADAEATKLAESLPDSLSEPVEKAFKRNVEENQRKYDNARYAASSADSIIRDYLGV